MPASFALPRVACQLLGLAALAAARGAPVKSLLFVGQAKAAPEIAAADTKARSTSPRSASPSPFADQHDPVTVAGGKDVIVISSG